MLTQDLFYLPRCAITATDPDYLRRKTMQQAQFIEVRVLAYNEETLITSVVPYLNVLCLIQTKR